MENPEHIYIFTLGFVRPCLASDWKHSIKLDDPEKPTSVAKWSTVASVIAPEDIVITTSPSLSTCF